jgi:hypothetical protein
MRRSPRQDFRPSQLGLWLLQESCSSSVLFNLEGIPLGSDSNLIFASSALVTERELLLLNVS